MYLTAPWLPQQLLCEERRGPQAHGSAHAGAQVHRTKSIVVLCFCCRHFFFPFFRLTNCLYSFHQSPIEAEESVAAEGAETQEETTQIPQEAPKQRHLQHAGPYLLHPRQPPLADCPLLDK